MDVFVPDVVEQRIVLTDNSGFVFHSVESFYQDLFVGNQEVSHEILVGSKEERKDKLISYLMSKGVTGSRLLIIDPYFFGTFNKPYKELMIDVLTRLNPKEITVVINEENYNKNLYNTISQKVGCEIKVYSSENLHDRFWIIDEERGISLGTSLNGIHHKMIRIDDLRDEEVKTIVEEINRTKIEMKK